VPAFARGGAGAVAHAFAHPGYLGGLFINSAPLNTTSCSCWRSYRDARDYAFTAGGHADAIAAGRRPRRTAATRRLPCRLARPPLRCDTLREACLEPGRPPCLYIRTAAATLEAFANALELGATTLELDVRLSADGRPIVTHDRRVSPVKCRDTAAAVAGDPEFPYVGDLIGTLTVAQLATLDCGFQQLPGFPRQTVIEGTRMPLLGEVLTFADCYRDDGVLLSIDPKFPADAPGESAPRMRLVRAVARAIRNVDEFDGSLVAAAASFGADAVAPVHGTPSTAGVGDDGYSRFTTRKLVRRAHRAGLKVISWTVDDPATMRSLLDARVDGIITGRPDIVRSLLDAQ